MPSAANAKSEKPASSEAVDNSPIRQIITIIEHKIRNLEKRKSKLTSYRDLQKAGKELNSDQKVAVAKYDEVAQTLEFARDLSKQVTIIATAAEREAKKQAKKDAWVRYSVETNKIREVLLILDCLAQMGNNEAREDFLNGSNGAAKLTAGDMKILDNLYLEVTPKHEVNEEGQAGFHTHTIKAAEHLYAIIDGKPKEVLGTTYTHIKEIVNSVHECGYFDKSADIVVPESEECQPVQEDVENIQVEVEVEELELEPAAPVYAPPVAVPAPPVPAVLPAPGYPLRPLPPITLQEVEHAYFSQQYPQQRPISEVIGSQNFFFLQESEIDSPIGTPQPPILNQASPPGPIPTQTFTNQHYVQIPGGRVPEPGSIPMPPQPHFAPHPEHAYLPAPPLPHLHPAHTHHPHQVIPVEPIPPSEEHKEVIPMEDRIEEDSKESRSPERDDDRKTQGQGDGQNRYRRYRGGGGGGGRGSSNGFRGRGSFQNRQNNDGYHPRHNNDYQNRSKEGYQGRQYDGYQSRHKDGYQARGADAYYGNGDAGDSHHENGGHNYQGYKGRGRGARGGPRGAPRPPRAHHHQYNNRRADNVEL